MLLIAILGAAANRVFVPTGSVAAPNKTLFIGG